MGGSTRTRRGSTSPARSTTVTETTAAAGAAHSVSRSTAVLSAGVSARAGTVAAPGLRPKIIRCSGAAAVVTAGAHQATIWHMARVSAT